MSQKLKVNFVDFWPGFIPEESYFFEMLGGQERVELSLDPDIVFYSNFGRDYKKYKCFRIFYSSENERTNWFDCDIALTFDYSRRNRHFRLPLFVLFAHRYGFNPKMKFGNLDKGALVQQWKSKKFCCIVVSNGLAKKRIDFFNFLSTKEKIDSGGNILNNVGGPIDSKIDFIRNYKFVISFENSTYPGYTTEKIFEPFITDSIPIYWGDPCVKNDFNVGSFVNCSDFNDYEQIYSYMKFIESDDSIIESFLFNEKIIDNDYWDMKIVRDWILNQYSKIRKPKATLKYAVVFSYFTEKIAMIKYWLVDYTIGHSR